MKKIILITLLALFMAGVYGQDRKVSTLTVKKTFGYDAVNTSTVTDEVDTINWTLGNFHKLTLIDTVTVTFTAPPLPCELMLVIQHDTNTTVFPITWPATVKWVGGAAVNTTEGSGAIDIVKFYFNGTNYYDIGKHLDIK